MTHDLGHTSHFACRLSIQQKTSSYQASRLVPLKSGLSNSIQIFAFPKELHSLAPSQYLKNLVALYFKDPETMRYLKTTKNIGDQVTRYQLESEKLERQGKVFEFFKYTSRGKVKEENNLSEVSSKDYDFLPDFHPFLSSPRNHQVLSIPVTYFDDKTGQTTKIDIMGWYIKASNSNEIRWKPKYIAQTPLAIFTYFC